MDNKIYLPEGTVIKLKSNPEHNFIIHKIEYAHKGKQYDYLGSYHNSEKLNYYLINEEDIEKVIFIGYQDSKNINKEEKRDV